LVPSSTPCLPEEEEQLTSAPVEPEAETVQEVGSSNESSQDVAADRLNWAKAAYKNIQQSKQAQETGRDIIPGKQIAKYQQSETCRT